MGGFSTAWRWGWDCVRDMRGSRHLSIRLDCSHYDEREGSIRRYIAPSEESNGMLIRT